MSGILDLLNSPMGRQIINGVSSQTGQPANKTGDVLSMAMPVLMGAMQRNATTQEGASGILGALSGKHSGGILDNLGGLFEGGVDQEVRNDGAGILGHILGSKRPAVENALSQKSGVEPGSVSEILKVAAPILMGILGKQASQQNVNDSNGLMNLLGGLSGAQRGSKQQSLIESFLDADGDGSILDDVAGMIFSGSTKKKGGLGGILGGLFGK
ncbi:DUF937 domain-containing protein [Aquimarina sp. U1-2]|uniref:DUF937 domain-containing protein n=1 Tax=Aquimarina sp. U1-2 TaxID=2823141 RepID=UPI001AECA20B|nr:DUF937 domain-containing protein [Aquimarina sp. U1-2]MBP2832704.1 DUF937 domain-containing protein [Aquimarina sp. U1-2]